MPKEEDADRPLTPEGKADAEALGAFLAARGVSADTVYHSGKTRARQTAEPLASALGAGIKEIDGIGGGDGARAFARCATTFDHDAVLVSHMPFVERIVSAMAGGNESAGAVDFEPGAAVCMTKTQEHGWSIEWMLRPRMVGAASA